MRLRPPVIALVATMVIAEAALSQTLDDSQAAYKNLPSVAAPPSTDAAMTIVPAAAHMPATHPPVEGSIVEMQPWAPEGEAHAQATPTMSHAISAEPWDGGWFAAVELMIFSPYFYTGGATINRRHTEVGPRLLFGWESDRGLGFRGRFADINTDSEVLTVIGTTEEMDLETFRFDFDVYREFDFQWSSITLGGSVTVADVEANSPTPGPAEERGAGVGFFVEGRHAYNVTNVGRSSVIARGRWAGLVGQWEHDDGVGLINADSVMQIFEAGLGWECKRDFETCSFVFQHLIEIQAWDTRYIGDPSFFGQSVSFGFTF